MAKKNREIFEKLISECREGLNSLNTALELLKEKGASKDFIDLFFDGMLKRFDRLFITTSHLLKMSLSQEGIEAVSPLQSIQEAFRLNWINDVSFWTIALDARSSSINHMHDFSRREYINITSQFATEVEIILNLITELRV